MLPGPALLRWRLRSQRYHETRTNTISVASWRTWGTSAHLQEDQALDKTIVLVPDQGALRLTMNMHETPRTYPRSAKAMEATYSEYNPARERMQVLTDVGSYGTHWECASVAIEELRKGDTAPAVPMVRRPYASSWSAVNRRGPARKLLTRMAVKDALSVTERPA